MNIRFVEAIHGYYISLSYIVNKMAKVNNNGMIIATTEIKMKCLLLKKEARSYKYSQRLKPPVHCIAIIACISNARKVLYGKKVGSKNFGE